MLSLNSGTLASLGSEALSLLPLSSSSQGLNIFGEISKSEGQTSLSRNLNVEVSTILSNSVFLKSAVPRPDPFESPASNIGNFGAFPKFSRHARRRDRIPKSPTEKRFLVLHRWQGQILSVGPESFDAQLLDQSDPTLIERATFQKTEVKPNIIKMIIPGATFYWILGLEDSADGQRRRASVLWMKRGGQITYERYMNELKKVREIWGSIEWSKPETATGS